MLDQEVKQTLQNARAHVKSGAYAEALDSYSWVYENGMVYDPMWIGPPIRLWLANGRNSASFIHRRAPNLSQFGTRRRPDCGKAHSIMFCSMTSSR